MSAGSDGAGHARRDRAVRLGAAAVLFAAAALVVVWQNSRVAILWDLAYILNTAARIAAGEVPYRDFPLPHAPGTFLVQALLVRLLDGPYVVQIAYAAVVSGVSAVATYGIVRRLLDPSLPGGPTALALSAPATILGVYAVYPHPFYDPDCSAVILAAILGLLVSERRGWPPLASVLAGTLLPLPFFFKQNTGGAFAVLAGAALCAGVLGRRGLHPWRGLCPLAGAFASLVVMLAALHATAGLGAFYQWTISFAGSRRLAASPLSLALYGFPAPHIALATAAAGVAVARWASRRWLAVGLAVVFLSVPFVPLLTGLVPSFGALDALLRWMRVPPLFAIVSIWPSVLLLSVAATGVRLVRHGPRFDVLLPLVLVGVTHAAFLSQGAMGSSYAIWPLLVIMLAAHGAAVAELAPVCGPAAVKIVLPLAGILLTIAGVSYVRVESRLWYAKIYVRPINRAEHPRLAGMATGGPYLPDLDALLRFCEREIPSDEAILTLPGEDPLYFALRRRPALPVSQFDFTLNPYSVPQLVHRVRDGGVRWIIVKEALQLNFQPFQPQPQLLQALASDFTESARVGPYRILRRSAAGR